MVIVHAALFNAEELNIFTIRYRVAHEKPARRLLDQRGRRFRNLYRKLNKCKCKVLNG